MESCAVSHPLEAGNGWPLIGNWCDGICSRARIQQLLDTNEVSLVNEEPGTSAIQPDLREQAAAEDAEDGASVNASSASPPDDSIRTKEETP